MNQLAKIAAKNIALIDKVETTKYFIQKSKVNMSQIQGLNLIKTILSWQQNFVHMMPSSLKTRSK